MYDYVFVTHLPAFYKVNLYNELAKKMKIFVIFIGKESNIRTGDFVKSTFHFEHVFLNEGPFEGRPLLHSCVEFAKKLSKLQFKKIVVGGWDLPEFWVAFFTNPSQRLALALESTVQESGTRGIRGFLKKFFLSKVSLVFASGSAHVALLAQLGYHREVRITRGVGLIHKTHQKVLPKPYEKKFLYLGRLSPEKNIPLLLQAFKSLPDFQLSLVGSGPLKEQLAGVAPPNVHLLGHVPNEGLFSLFESHDFLILPSLSEPWGLVVEEALYFGRPVLVSERCGASELVGPNNGFKFNPESVEEFRKIILSINDSLFQQLTQNIKKFSIDEKDDEQVSSYRL